MRHFRTGHGFDLWLNDGHENDVEKWRVIAVMAVPFFQEYMNQQDDNAYAEKCAILALGKAEFLYNEAMERGLERRKVDEGVVGDEIIDD